MPVPLAARSKTWVYGLSLAKIVGSHTIGGVDICCEWCVFSGKGLCVGLIIHLEEFYRMWCVWVWSWSFGNEEVLAHWGGGGVCWTVVKNKYIIMIFKFVLCQSWPFWLLIHVVQKSSYATAKHVYKYGKVHKQANFHLLFAFVSPDITKVTENFQEIPGHACKCVGFILLRVHVDYV
jgi:hypothetical protein